MIDRAGVARPRREVGIHLSSTQPTDPAVAFAKLVRLHRLTSIESRVGHVVAVSRMTKFGSKLVRHRIEVVRSG